ncbi:hypothetical protein QEV13_07010 [Trueperella pyogenes]|uniref:hypothetical protein n=1 Tax=Trueperella pyogenes TaxID=1661 RepID=UPI0024C0C24B|nr:hypothetical protein [Trueperella pyogenes]WHU60401.1 hypothetical protein QEV13_07010 [Trueperella pyogenes]
MRIRGTPKAFVESDVGRDTWLRTRESEFCYRRARCLATRDIQTTRTEDFWRVAHSQELIRAFRGYAAQPVDSTLPPWDQEKMRVFQTVDYLDRHRQSFSATTTVAYAALTAAVLIGLPTIISHPHEAIRVSTCRLRRTKNTRTHVVAVKPRTVAFAGFRVTSIEQTIIDLARLYGAEHGLVAADFALAHLLTTTDALVSLFDSMPAFHGRKRVRAMLALMDGRRESVGESLMFYRFAEAALPLPTPQLTFWIRGQQMRPDAVDEEKGYVFSFDGNAKIIDPEMTKGRHYRELAIDASWKERLLADAGYRTFHLGWEDVRTTAGFRKWLDSRVAFGLAY